MKCQAKASLLFLVIFSQRARRNKNPPLPSKWQKALNRVVDTHFKIEIIVAELEYGELGFFLYWFRA